MKNITADNVDVKCEKLGITTGKSVDIRELERIEKSTDLNMIIYFEEELARNSTYEKDLLDNSAFPEHERPFISVSGFLDFQREMNPMFDDALASIPLMIEIVYIGSYSSDEEQKPLVKGVLPFLDEVDLD